MLISGFIGSFFPAFLFTAAGQHIDSGISGSLNGLSPLFTLLVGLWFFKAKTPWQGYAGILVGLAGALALSLVRAHAGAELNVWSLLIVLATFMYGINLNVIKHHLADVHPLTITSGALVPLGVAGLAVLAFGTPFFGRVSDPGFWGLPLAASLTLGIFGSALSIIVYNRVIKNTSALMASTVTYLMPVVALGWGLWDGELIQGWQIIGLVLVLAGMGLVGWASRVRIEN
jgi:drug/metabolite transporter (DMT)-like permease